MAAGTGLYFKVDSLNSNSANAGENIEIVRRFKVRLGGGLNCAALNSFFGGDFYFIGKSIAEVKL